MKGEDSEGGEQKLFRGDAGDNMIAIKPRWVKSTAMSGPAAVGETSVTQNQGFILMNLSAKAVSSRVNIIGHGLHGAEQSFIRL